MSHVRRARLRRRPRHRAGWFGQYLIESRAEEGWHGCRVVDVSQRGSGLELFGPPVEPGDRLLVELQMTQPGMVDHPLRAAVRHVGKGYEGGLAAGVEFLEIDDLGRGLLRLVISMQSV
jgi:hypothetical protein